MKLIAQAGSLSSADLSQKKAELKLKHKVCAFLVQRKFKLLKKMQRFVLTH